MDDFEPDFLFDMWGDDEASSPAVGETVATTVLLPADPADLLVRTQSHWQQIPLPPELPLCGTNVLAGLDDELLLSLSPSVIAHIQRSEASGGMQVISPRAVTLGGIAARTGHSKRTTDMFLVGSAAGRQGVWPTLGTPVPDYLLGGEPIDSYPNDPAVRARTVSQGLLPSAGLVHDPITRAFLTGRALVDLQRRADVAGSASELAAILATCWGLDVDDYEDLAEASLAPVGSLLRYAIRSDDVYPMVNAPVHARKCISVGANTAGRRLYGDSSAVDWRRMRVLAESVFYQATRIEGHTLVDMSLALPPGNPRAPPNRPGILQMRPLPGAVWCFDSHTFRLDIACESTAGLVVPVPPRVRTSITAYHAMARPVAWAAGSAAGVSFSSTIEAQMESETAESLVAGYRTVLSRGSAFSARGRTAVAAVRGFLYDCMSSSVDLPNLRALWLVRYMNDTTNSLNLTHLLDATTSRHVAARMTGITDDLRMRLGVEAGRRGTDLNGWWTAMSAQLPRELSSMAEGSASWAIGAAHLLLHPPTPKWAALTRAMAHASHRAMARTYLKDVRLPAVVGSAERSFAAGSAVARQLGASYGAFYGAMHDVASVLAGRLRRGGSLSLANKVELAGLMWDIRAKVASTVTLHGEDGTSDQAGRITTRQGTYHITIAPYPAYQRWLKRLNEATFVTRPTKQQFPHHTPPVLSTVFSGIRQPLFLVSPSAASRLFRYSGDPSRLAADIESTLRELLADVRDVMVYYDDEKLASDLPPEPLTGESIPLGSFSVDVEQFRPVAGTYWDLISSMEPLDAQDIVDTVIRMDKAQAEEIEQGSYSTQEELKELVWGLAASAKEAVAAGRDAVI